MNARASDESQPLDLREYEPSHTAAMEAARWEDSAVLPLLLDRGADLNARDNYNRTAFSLSVTYGAPNNARLLLEAGAQFQEAAEHGWSTLNIALGGHFYEHGEPLRDQELRARRIYDLVVLLLEHGADPNFQPQDGGSVLAGAITRCDLALVRLLLDAGADISKFKTGNSVYFPLETLARSHNADAAAIAALLAERGLQTDREELNNSLRNAAWQGDAEMVRQLLDRDADIESRTSEGATTLYRAASAGHADVVEFLLSRGADVNSRRGESQMTPLMGAVWNGHSHFLRESRLPYADKPDPDAWVAAQDLATVHALLDAGADVLARDSSQATALHFAARNSTPEIVQVLVEAGAEVNARSKFDSTPLHSVLKRGRRQRLFQKEPHLQILHAQQTMYGATYGATAHHDEGILRLKKATEQDEATVRALLESGAEVSAADNAGNTPLHQAALFATPAAVQMLLEAGADVEAANRKGKTPLQQVLAEGRCARMLAQHGLPLSDIEGMPGDLLRAASGEIEGGSIFASAKPEVSITVEEDVAVLRLLLKAGALTEQVPGQTHERMLDFLVVGRP